MSTTNASPSGADRFLPRFLTPAVLRRSLMIALVVGPILTLINQGDRIFLGLEPDWLKVGLTHMVPFCVATVSAWLNARQACP